MLDRVTAVRFDKSVSTGRTKPCILGCEKADGAEVELIVKFAAGCEMKQRSLAAEAIAAMLAADLDLPVPEPFAVRVDPDFAATIGEAVVRARAQASIGWNFGSKKLPPGFATYPKDKPIPQALSGTAAEILAFDTFIVNPDRTVANPNLLSNGRALAIYDHELAFLTEGVLFWKPPWQEGGIVFPKGQPPKVRHVFLEELRGQTHDFSRLFGAFEGITDGRLLEYRQALPEEWIGDGVAVTGMLDYIAELKHNIESAITQLTGALR